MTTKKTSIIILTLFLILTTSITKEFKRTLSTKSTETLTTKTTTVNANNENYKDFDVKNFFLVPISVGNPPQTIEVSLDTASDYSWVAGSNCSSCTDSEQKFNSKSSTTYKSNNNIVEIKNRDGVANGKSVSDNLNLSNYKTKNFNFIVVDSLDNEYSDYKNGILSFSYKTSNGVGFLDALKENNQIGKKILTLRFSQEDFGSFFIGEYPNDMDRKKVKEVKTCNISDKSDFLTEDFKNKWVCDLTHGIVGKDIKNSFEINGFAYFDSGSTVILAPNKYIDLFKAEYLNTCEEKTENGDKYFTCEKSSIDLDNVKPLYFVLGGWAFEIPASSLFKLNYDSSKYYFTVRFTNTTEVWGFGKNFMRQFTTIFNKDEANVGFYGGNYFNFKDEKAKLDGTYVEKIMKKNILGDIEEDVDATNEKALKTEKEKKMKLLWNVGGVVLIVVFLVLIILCIYRSVRKPKDDDLKPLI